MNGISNEKEIEKEAGSTFIQYDSTPEQIVGMKPLYFDSNYDPNPWPMKEVSLL